MALINYIFGKGCLKNDTKRDAGKPLPTDLKEWKDLAYDRRYGKWGHLDVYRKDVDGLLPTIVVVHGGGYLYGTKEIYSRYAKALAHDGYVVVCFNYPLAPGHRFPTQLYCLGEVLSFTKEHGKEWGADLSRVYLYGDSAGANLSYLFGLAQSSEEYRELFPGLRLDLKVNGLSLNCGLYSNLGTSEVSQTWWMWKYFLPRHSKKSDPRFQTVSHINPSFPPTYLMTSDGDFLHAENAPFKKRLEEANVPLLYEDFVGQGEPLGHVFHLDVDTDDARKARFDSERFLASF